MCRDFPIYSGDKTLSINMHAMHILAACFLFLHLLIMLSKNCSSQINVHDSCPWQIPPHRILTFKESVQPLFCDTLSLPALYLVLLSSGNSKRYSTAARWSLSRKSLPKLTGLIRHFRIHVHDRRLIFFGPSTPFSPLPSSVVTCHMATQNVGRKSSKFIQWAKTMTSCWWANAIMQSRYLIPRVMLCSSLTIKRHCNKSSLLIKG